MTYVFSPDGVTVVRRYRNLPARHWEALSANSGMVHELTEENAASWGYHMLVEVPQPSEDHVFDPAGPQGIINTGPGQFTRSWVFSQEMEDARLDDESREIDAGALRDDFQNAKSLREAAVADRAEMDSADPAFLPKWADVDVEITPLSGAGTNGAKIDEATALINDVLLPIVKDQAKMINLLKSKRRQDLGDTRFLASMLVRKFRKDRDDV